MLPVNRSPKILPARLVKPQVELREKRARREPLMQRAARSELTLHSYSRATVTHRAAPKVLPSLRLHDHRVEAAPASRVRYSPGPSAGCLPIAAAALGATIIEKHFTISRKLSGPDHKSSLEPKELVKMISSIRNIEIALGDGIKKPVYNEIVNINNARKSIVAKKNIKAINPPIKRSIRPYCLYFCLFSSASAASASANIL